MIKWCSLHRLSLFNMNKYEILTNNDTQQFDIRIELKFRNERNSKSTYSLTTLL